jgi:hypothetical protein
VRETRNIYEVLAGSSKCGDNLEHKNVDGRVMLKYSLQKEGVKTWASFNSPRRRSSGRFL